MKRKYLFLGMVLVLSACSLSNEERAKKEQQRLKAEQQLQIQLAQQCDGQTADLIAQQFNPPADQTLEQKQKFDEKYAQKVGNPMFQACFDLLTSLKGGDSY